MGFIVRPSTCAAAGAPGARSAAARNVRRIMLSLRSVLVTPRGLVTRLDAIPDLGLERHAVEAVDLLQAGRRGDVDLGEVVTDHVDADEDHPEPGQFRPDRVADLAVAP